MHLFGIQDEAVREQINYVLDVKLNKCEKHLKITCGSAGGQNNNNATTTI